MLGFGPILEAFFFCQSEEMLVSLGWDSLLKIHSFVKKNKYGSQKNQGYKRLA